MKIRVAILTIGDKSLKAVSENSGGRAVEDGLLGRKIIQDGFIRELPKAEEGDIEYEIVAKSIVPAEKGEIEKFLKDVSENNWADLVLTTGGTGLLHTDVAPEAVRSIIEKEIPGIPEMLRMEAAQNTGHPCLFRGVSGTRAKTLIINLPTGPNEAIASLQLIKPVLKHAIEALWGHFSE